MRAYHFCATDADCNAILRDGNVIEPGAIEVFKGAVEICRSGLHASKHVRDALDYAPGSMLRLVECTDVVAREHDKFVCRRRVEVARFDAAALLGGFACDCAERVLPIFEREHPGDKRPRLAIETKRRHLAGKATDGELAAAWAAARAAARDAAGTAARDAAGAAARDAAWDSAWAAAGTAAWAAAWAAARAAARDAAWAAARAAARDAAGTAARDAAWAAARDAAWDSAWAAAWAAAMDAETKWQRTRLARLVNREFKRIMEGR